MLQAHMATLLELSPDPVFALDLDGCFITGNAALGRLTGHPVTDLIGQPLLSLLTPATQDVARQHFTNARAGSTQRFEVAGSTVTGGEFVLDITCIPAVSAGAVTGVYCLAREVTQQRAAERELDETEQRYRLLADNVQDMISLHDHTGTFIYASPSARRLLGVAPEDLIGRSVYELIEPADVSVLLGAHDDIMRREGHHPAVFRVTRANGTVGWFESTARMVTRPGSNEPWRIIAVTRDITERRAVEQQLMRSQKMEALGRLAGGVAHDFNNVLTAIAGHAELLIAGLPSGTRERENAEHIREAAQRAAGLTRQLLTFGRGEALDARVTDLNAVILDLQPMLARLLSDDVVLQLDLDPALAGVRCEASRLEQIVINLAVNARDAMPGGGALSIRTANVELDADPVAGLAAGRYVRLVVCDDGEGMDAAVAARAFEPFFTTKPPGVGTGLGLSTVYSIVSQTGGTIALDTAPGEGSCFRIHLPGTTEAVHTTADGRLSPAGSLNGTETILVAEDDEGVRAFILGTLQRYGYHVIPVADGAQAVDLFRARGAEIDLVVTDVNMPHMKGPDMVRMLEGTGWDVPVLYISGFTADSLALDEVNASRAFLAKPFRPVDLAQAVRGLLGGVRT
jgi:two-component system, cell cycle sensor histidine kinase and response regulator CckA